MRSAVGLGLVAVVVVAAAWLQSPPDITGAEAVRAARGAFRAAGVEGARVDGHPKAGTYQPPDGGAPLPVWRTSTRVRGGTVQLWLAREDAEPVFLDDRSGDGAVQLLSDAQFRALAAHYENPATGRQVRRNLVLTVAAALATAVAVQWELHRRRLQALVPWPAPRRPSVAGPVEPPPSEASRAAARAATLPPPRSGPISAPPRSDRPLRAQEIL